MKERKTNHLLENVEIIFAGLLIWIDARWFVVLTYEGNVVEQIVGFVEPIIPGFLSPTVFVLLVMIGADKSFTPDFSRSVEPLDPRDMIFSIFGVSKGDDA